MPPPLTRTFDGRNKAGTVTERYDRFWAEYLGIAPAEFNQPGLSIGAHVGLQGFRGIWCFRRRNRTVVSAPSGWIPYLRSRLPDVGQENLMDESFLRQVFGNDFDRLVGPAYQGYLLSDRFRAYAMPHTRFLGPDDAAAVEAFRMECGQDVWEYAGLDEATSYLVGGFEGNRIVSLAGYRSWSDEAGDPCVLTHSLYRGRGWATATTSAVVGRVLNEGKVLLYQTLETNTAAIKIARRLGYEQYARHVAVRLRAETPSNPALQRPGMARR